MAASVSGLAVAKDLEDVEDLEIDLLLEGVYRRFGHDFRGYRRDVVRSRLQAVMRDAGVATVSALQDKVMHDEASGSALLLAMRPRSVAMFDDVAYFRALREKVLPWLRSFPAPKVWIAECATTEEVSSLAILLAEEGLHDRTQVYATASSELFLQEAQAGTFRLDRGPEYAENYHKSGGRTDLADYYHQANGKGTFHAELYANVTWAQYNLATDASFNEFQLIICRHAFCDFGAALQRRVLQLFADSMPLFGMLSVDCDEGLKEAPFPLRFTEMAGAQSLYRRIL